jgi:hypothetical protein
MNGVGPMRSILVVGAVLFTGGLAGSTDEKPRKVKPVVVFSGTDSAVEKRSYVRCLSEKELNAVWSKLCGKDWKKWRTPRVDFESQMVVVIFNGNDGSDSGVEVPEVVEASNHLKINFRVLYYQTGVRESVDGVLLPIPDFSTRSYAIVVTPRTAKEVVFEEDINNVSGAPPKWKEVARLPAVRGK